MLIQIKMRLGHIELIFNAHLLGKVEMSFIKFGSVRSAFYLWINGQKVGYSQGSKTTC